MLLFASPYDATVYNNTRYTRYVVISLLSGATSRNSSCLLFMPVLLINNVTAMNQKGDVLGGSSKDLEFPLYFSPVSVRLEAA